MHRYMLLTSVLFVILQFVAIQSTCADIILDDFVDDVHIVTPEHEFEKVVHLSVGALGAERSVSINPSIAEVVGMTDVNILNPSQATLVVESVQRDWEHLSPGVFQAFDYDFPVPVDLTHGGTVDAFFVDFDLIRGPHPPQDIRFLVQQDVGGRRTFWALWFGINEERLQPVTAVLPFSLFTARGGGPFAPEFISVPQLDVDIMSLGDDNAQWEVVIDAIRIGALTDGDYNADGFVGQEDLDLVLLSWGSEVAPFGWYHDLPISGVGQDELDKVLLNWGTRIVPPSVAGTGVTAIPEPASAVLLVLMCAALVVTRRSRVD